MLSSIQTINLRLLLSCFVTFIALVNPIQKVFVINSLQQQFNQQKLRLISLKSSLTAFIILIIFLVLGQFIFNYIFHIQLYAFKITCGVVLFYNGISGLQKGVFFKFDKNISIKDITAVPIAIPMIAGPATITSAVTLPAHYGYFNTIVSIIAALFINYIFMFFAERIGRFLTKLNLMNSLVRIFGLIVATIGVQLILNGLSEFIATL